MLALFRNIGFRTIKVFSDMRRDSRLREHVRSLPSISSFDREIVNGLEHEGVFITSLEKLNMPSGHEVFQEAHTLIPHLGKSTDPNARKGYASHATAAQLMDHNKLISLGLEERFLNIVENYLGLPVSYRGLTFRNDMANGENVETRLWHRDDEDYRIVKIVVYLNDVDTHGGPFTYIPKYLTPNMAKLKFTEGRVLDHDMKKAVPDSKWVECTGKAGAVVFADPCNIFHRGKMPTAQDRYTLFYCYNSRYPLKPKYCSPLFSREEFMKRASHLSERQKQSIAK